MTVTGAFSHEKQPLPTGILFLGSLGVFLLLLILRNTAAAMEYVGEGLRLCVVSVIPALFPFMVLSELAVSSGIAERLLSPVLKPFCRLFRVSASGGCAAILGILCGFPIGARAVAKGMECGKIGRAEAENILLFSNIPSPAFLIGAVGLSMFGDRRVGIRLWIAALLSALLTGFLLIRTQKKRLPDEKIFPENDSSRRSVSGIFTHAVSSAAGGMLTVCAYVVFFSTFVGVLGILLDALSCPVFVRSFLFCFFELTGGIRSAAAIPSPSLAALACGWSGLSVHCQILSVCDGKGLRYGRYFFSKLLQGFLCVLFLTALNSLFPI